MALMATVPVIVVTVLAASIAARSAEAEIVRTATSRMRWAVQYLDDGFGRISSLFYSLQSDALLMEALGGPLPEGRAEEQRIRAGAYDLLARSLYANPGLVSSIAYLDSARKKVFSFDYAAGAFASVPDDSKDPWSRVESERNSMFFYREKGATFACRTVRRFEDRRAIGALSVRVDEGFGSRLRQILSPDDDWPALVADSAGGIVYGEGGGALSAALELILASPGGTEGVVGFFRSGDSLVFSEPAFEGRLIVAKAVPLRAITMSARATAAAGLWTGLAFAIISLLLAVYASHRLSSPIVALARRMESSGIPEDIEHSSGAHDEIAVLEHSYNAMLGRIRDLIDSEYRREIELGKARLAALQARINPHYLHNTLNLVGGIALARGIPEIHRIALAMGRALRYAAEEGSELVPLERELESARDYLFIQEQRFAGRFAAKVDTPPEGTRVMLPRLTIQPVLENCFEHGFEGGSGAWRVGISVRYARGRAAVIVRDNGQGFDPERLAELRAALSSSGGPRSVEREGGGPSQGLANVDARLKLRFGGDCGLRVFSRGGIGTTIMLLVRVDCGEGEAPCTES